MGGLFLSSHSNKSSRSISYWYFLCFQFFSFSFLMNLSTRIKFSYPCLFKHRTIQLPMKPAAPVTIMVCGCSVLFDSLFATGDILFGYCFWSTSYELRAASKSDRLKRNESSTYIHLLITHHNFL